MVYVEMNNNGEGNNTVFIKFINYKAQISNHN